MPLTLVPQGVLSDFISFVEDSNKNLYKMHMHIFGFFGFFFFFGNFFF